MEKKDKIYVLCNSESVKKKFKLGTALVNRYLYNGTWLGNTDSQLNLGDKQGTLFSYFGLFWRFYILVKTDLHYSHKNHR